METKFISDLKPVIYFIISEVSSLAADIFLSFYLIIIILIILPSSPFFFILSLHSSLKKYECSLYTVLIWFQSTISWMC